jgi:hypothetical protein
MIYLGKKKGKTVPACAMKGQRGSRGTAPLSLDTGARYRRVGKKCIGGWVGPRPVWTFWRIQISCLSLPGFKHWTVQSVA